jgi:hypothetical protein
LCFSPDINRLVKSRRLKWAEYIAGMEAMRNAYSILIRKAKKGRGHLGVLELDRIMI